MLQPGKKIFQVKPSLMALMSLVFFLLKVSSQDCIEEFDPILLKFDSALNTSSNLKKIEFLDSLLIEAKNYPCPISESDILRRLGIAYYLNDQDDFAIRMFNNSIEVATEIDYEDGKVSGYMNLADLNYRRGSWKDAVTSYEAAYWAFKSSGYWIGQFDAYQSMASVFLEMDSLEKSKKMSFEILSLSRNQEYSSFIPVASYITISRIHRIEQNCDSALYYHEIVNPFLISSNDHENLHISSKNMAECYESQGNFDLAIAYYNEALDYAKKLNRKDYISELSDKIIFINSLLNERNVLITRNNYLLIGLAIFLLTTAISVYLFFRKRAMVKAQEAGKLLKEQEMNAIEAMLKGQDQERRRIAEELHDSLGGLLSAIKLHFNKFSDDVKLKDKALVEKYEFTSVLLDDASKEVRRISHDLHSGVLVKFGLKPALEQLSVALENIDKPKFHFFFNDVDKRYDSDVEINCFRIVQECVSNILKHADASDVTIQVSQLNGTLKLMVEDDGRGFDPGRKRKGIGLNNISVRTGRLNGQLNIDSTPGIGTTLIVDLPVE